MTIARKNQIDLAQTPYYHCVNRCVRRAFLCGEDLVTGENYEHRREWIVTKLKELSSVFFIDICAYAIMHNHYHYHVILKVDNESAEHYSDKEVANRWIQFFKAPLLVSNWLKENEQTQAEKDNVTNRCQVLSFAISSFIIN